MINECGMCVSHDWKSAGSRKKHFHAVHHTVGHCDQQLYYGKLNITKNEDTNNQMFDIFSFNDLHLVTTPGCVDTQPTRHTPGMLATCVTQCPGFRHSYFGNATGSKGLRFEIGFR